MDRLPTATLGTNPGSVRRRPREVLRVSDLSITCATDAGSIEVVSSMDLSIGAGETVGLVGESGSGKTISALAIMGLLPPGVRVVSGSVEVMGEDFLALSERELVRRRGRQVAMIFQEPRRSLNPAITVGEQIAEVVRRHLDLGRRDARKRSVELLELVGIREPARRASDYPHQLSGGMCQRVMIAAAIACEPQLLIADEPTTALDATVQARILQLIDDLQSRLNLSILFITHDLGVVAEMCDRVVVMYAGEVVEDATAHDLFVTPRHPYTAGLIAAVPDVKKRSRVLSSIAGRVPAPGVLPDGCRFHPRCEHAVPGRCDRDEAIAIAFEPADGSGSQVRCVRHAELDLRGVEQ